MISQRILLLLVFSGLILQPIVVCVATAADDVPPETLQMTIDEEILLQDSGLASITIELNASGPTLADIYRKMLGTSDDVGIEEEIQMPETTMAEASVGDVLVEVPVPVKENILPPIVKEQLLSLGLNMSIQDSRIIPRGAGNECRIVIDAVGFFPATNVTHAGSDDIWSISVGPFNVTGLAGLIFTKIIFAQSLLGSIAGNQTYQSLWRTKIVLPNNSELLNVSHRDSQWRIQFSDNTYVHAAMYEESSAIVLEERILVTDEDFSADPESLYQSMTSYRILGISYSLPCDPSEHGEHENTDALNTNWSHTWTVHIPEVSVTKTIENETEGWSIFLRLYFEPTFDISLDVGWQYHTQWWPPPFIFFDRFWASCSLDYSVKLGFEVSGEYGREWVWPVSQMRLPTFWFLAYIVPVWIDTSVHADAVIKLDVEASFVVEALVEGGISKGLQWKSGLGWTPSQSERPMTPHLESFGWNAYVDVMVEPSIRLRIEFMFFSVAGPYLEFEPYVRIEVETSSPDSMVDLAVCLGFRINIGVKWSDDMKSILQRLGAPHELFEDPRIPIYEPEPYLLLNQTWLLNDTLPGSPEVHGLSVVNLTTTPAMVFVGDIVDVNTLVRNSGYFNETSEVSFAIDDTQVETRNVSLSKGEDAPLSFIWNTAALVPSSYNLSIRARPVMNESNVEDNELTVAIQVQDSRDVAISEIGARDKVHSGRNLTVTAEVSNLGSVMNDFDLIIFANNFSVATWSIEQIAQGEEILLVTNWNTTGTLPGEIWTLWGMANVSQYDRNMTNNVLFGTNVTIYASSDLTMDGRVDITDLIMAANAFGSRLGDSRWDPMADQNEDGRVNVFDLILMARDFGKNWT